MEAAVRGSSLARSLSGSLGRFAGAVVSVVRPDGAEIVELGRGVGAETRIQIGSVTKAFTGLLLADALLRGELTPGVTVDALLLGKTSHERSITVRSLATHTAGLPRLSIGLRALLPDPYRGYTRAHLLRYLQRTQPILPLQPVYRYSNLGFAVLGLLLEQASGASYAELLSARVLQPLGLGETTLVLAGKPADVARGYACVGKTPFWLWPRPPIWHHDAYAPAGALASTASDLVRFAQQLLRSEGPAAPMLALASEPLVTIPGGSIGLAWHLPGSGRFVWHNGATFGHSAYVAVAPRLGVAVIAVANRPVATPMTQLGHTLMTLALA